MIALLLLFLLVALVLAAINHYAFPVPGIVWGIFAVLVIVVLFIFAVQALDGANLDIGDGRG